jgi:hypothetical protein
VCSRLAPGELFCHWIALWQAGPAEIELIADSLRAVFPQVEVWLGGRDEERVALALLAPLTDRSRSTLTGERLGGYERRELAPLRP